ncbi:MAG: glnB [Candidatus Eremiobacteraeota bacterium]|nr:glnB [Candidatus Eremiobacteraeota bacterium]
MRRRILNTMKRLEIVLECDQLAAVERVLDQHATGYTLVPGVTGRGHHGRHDDDIVLLVTVVTRDHLDPILDQLLPLLNRCSGVVVIADVQVLRGEHFIPEVKGKIGTPAFR